MSEKRIAHPVRELHSGTCRIVDAKGEWLSSKQVADALNAALEDAERLDWLSAADLRNFLDRVGGWRVILSDGSKSLGPFRALREAIDAARAAQMTPDEEAEVRSRIEARTNAKEKA